MTFLTELLILLGAAVTIVPLCKRLGLSSVLGYLAAGVLIGRPGLGIVPDPEAVLHLAEIGVVLLLFVIGLELQPRRLWVMRRLVFGLGSAQVVLSGVVIAGLLHLAGLAPGAALLLGFSLGLSSTAFVLQLLGEQKKLSHPHGRAAFGTLLLQDIAVIPLLAVVSLVATGSGAQDGPAGLHPERIAAVVVGAIGLRYALRPLLAFVAASGIQELFTAASLALVVGAALALEAAGLSMGLGAFAAGMMVADSEYRHQLETDVDPFKGLLLGLFFMAVGMTVDVGLLLHEPIRILGLTFALMSVKAALLVPLARAAGLEIREAVRTGLVLSQGGEFAFVLLTAGLAAGLVEAPLADSAILIVTLSMALTPVVVSLGDRWLESRQPERPFDTIEPQQTDVVIAGFGRVGQVVARLLTMRHIPFTALEIDPNQIDFVRSFGNEVYYGDASRLDVLRSAGVPRAKALVVAVGSMEASLRIVERVRASCPGVALLARATTRHHELRLREIGADYVLRDTLQSSLRLGGELLERLGLSTEEARHAVERFAEHDARTLERQSAVFRDEAAFRRETVSAAEELERLFAEASRLEPESDDATEVSTRNASTPEGRPRVDRGSEGRETGS